MDGKKCECAVGREVLVERLGGQVVLRRRAK